MGYASELSGNAIPFEIFRDITDVVLKFFSVESSGEPVITFEVGTENGIPTAFMDVYVDMSFDESMSKEVAMRQFIMDDPHLKNAKKRVIIGIYESTM